MEQNDIMLSICMIVKNEQRCLERCLKSIKPLKEHINCEVIVTDTGSTDKSVEIAEKYADKVLHFEWCNDFSAARNHGIEQAKGEWVMVMDADEELVEDVSHLVKFFNSEEKYRYTGAFCKMKNCFNAEVCNTYSSFLLPTYMSYFFPASSAIPDTRIAKLHAFPDTSIFMNPAPLIRFPCSR